MYAGRWVIIRFYYIQQPLAVNEIKFRIRNKLASGITLATAVEDLSFYTHQLGCKYDTFVLCDVSRKRKKNFFFGSKNPLNRTESQYDDVSAWEIVIYYFPKNIGKSKKKRVSSSDLFSVVQIRKKNVYFVILLHLRLYVSQVGGGWWDFFCWQFSFYK